MHIVESTSVLPLKVQSYQWEERNQSKWQYWLWVGSYRKPPACKGLPPGFATELTKSEMVDRTALPELCGDSSMDGVSAAKSSCTVSAHKLIVVYSSLSA